MRKLILLALTVALTILPLVAQSPASSLKVGDMAPDFTMKDQNNKSVKLSDFRGKENVALAFYVFAFTGGWTQEMKAFQQNLDKLKAADTQVLGVSMDSSPANKAWADQIGVNFPLLSDWGGDVTKEYGVYEPKYKAARRATFLIGKDGKIEEIQYDKQAFDPNNIVEVCQRKKLKS